MNSDEQFYNKPFSHIYIENDAFEYPITKKIIDRFNSATIIPINHYKDVFNRSKQNYVRQSRSQSLILAKQNEAHIYEGAPVCQNFGNEYFYYTSCVMNCIYDCEYCYLKGMYPSGNMVLFVNLEDTFEEIKAKLKEHPMYICVSYDTDLLAIESLTGYVEKWIDFVEENDNLTIEIRTKSANTEIWNTLKKSDRVIYAFTLSPEKIVTEYEHKTPSLKARLESIKMAQQKGHIVRLCFDPMIYTPDWKTHYLDMLDCVRGSVDMDKLWDVSVGSFRVSQDYLKKMRRNMPHSAVVQFPYQNTDGVYHYPDNLLEDMEGFMNEKLSQIISKDKIFRW